MLMIVFIYQKKEKENSFIKQKDPNQILELEVVIDNIKKFINPIINDDINNKKWNHKEENWE